MRFTRTEILHLSMSVVALSVAFMFVLPNKPFPDNLRVEPINALAAFLAVGSGFVLHELAHKLVAQRYGFWAEFRAQISGLVIAIGMAIGLGFLFAAPGAVLIWGRVDERQNGIVSIVGPLTNLAIAAIAYPFTFVANTESAGFIIADAVALVNSLLCVFNMLPIGPFDGRKVLRWNVFVWAGTLIAGLALFILVAFGTP